ncbi:signal recognition particle-docking protein FtsY [uncultured Lactobacillus sp.]|uniref:signal recognition particle-docking protein FtsY n=1 Tax=uncultured Lactobacillus sp. TaxID=153152 RepID=UPI0026261076|nr:signal recognition particle-docking protein FtsY [uncultured Lactobacillus sp.]
MGLFDKIKKSLFGKKEDEQEKENDQQEVETKQAPENEHLEDAASEVELENSDHNLEKETKQTEPNDRVWADAGSNLEQKNLDQEKEHEVQHDDSDNDVDNRNWTDAGSLLEKQNQVREEEKQEAKEKNEAEDLEQAQETEESESVEQEFADSQDQEIAQEDQESDQDRYDRGLEKTNHSFGAKLNAFFAKFRSVDEDFFDDLEDLLIESDVGFETAEQLTDSLRDEAKLKNAKSHDELKQVVVEKLVDIYDKGGQGKDSSLAYDENAKPNVYLFVGVNGAGKTTTIGKLAKRLKDSGKSVMMVAADTFRAGAVEQLVEWGRRDGVEVVTGKSKADPASVVFEGVSQAKEKGIDYLLVDTAGRLQNKVNLMNELDKIKRTIQKILPDQPNEILLVLDGSTGQNALLQAKDFDKTTKLTGLVLTKLDGSSKGGVVLAIRNEMDLPVKLVGLGEKVDDLADFDAEKFAIGLFQGLI